MRSKNKKIMIQGNEAAGLGCIYGGATVASWYPITPSTSLAEAFQKSLENAKHAVGTRELACLWAKKRYNKLSQKEKQEILNKIKD